MNRNHKGLGRVGDTLSAILMAAVAFTLISGVFVNFANILARYFFAAPFHWVEEVMTFMLVWITFLAAGAIAWEGKNLSIDLFVHSLPRKFRAAVVFAAMFATIAISAVMLKQSWTMVSTFLANEQTSLVARVQMEIPHGAIPIGFAMIILLTAMRMLSQSASIGEVSVDDVLEDLDLANVVTASTEAEHESENLGKGQ